MTTDFNRLEKLRIPSDVTDEQIYEMFNLVNRYVYASVHPHKKFRAIAKERSDELILWYLAQNFQNQVNEG